MKKTINRYEFIKSFKNSIYENSFSTQGLNVLFDYLEQLEEDIGEEIEFDIVAIVNDFTEYSSLEELKERYSNLNINTIEELKDYTEVIEIDDENIIIEDF